MNHDQLTAVIGQTLTVESVVSESGPAIAHLNVVSLDGVYVDLEDWSQDVTQPVPAGADTQLDWEFQAVNPGHFAVYVVLIPQNGPSSPGHRSTSRSRAARPSTPAVRCRSRSPCRRHLAPRPFRPAESPWPLHAESGRLTGIRRLSLE